MSTFSIPEGKYVDIGNVAGLPQRVHYHEQGTGDPVIFLHGACTGASGYSNFKGNYPVFAQAGYRSIVPDLLGYGLSSKPDIESYDLDFFVAGVKGLVDQLGLKNITLLGNSLGGAVAVTVAAIIVTGTFGNMIAESLFRLVRIRDPIAKGLALGTAAHAIGTAKAMEIGEVEGAMSSLALTVCGLLTAIAASFFAQAF